MAAWDAGRLAICCLKQCESIPTRGGLLPSVSEMQSQSRSISPNQAQYLSPLLTANLKGSGFGLNLSKNHKPRPAKLTYRKAKCHIPSAGGFLHGGMCLSSKPWDPDKVVESLLGPDENNSWPQPERNAACQHEAMEDEMGRDSRISKAAWGAFFGALLLQLVISERASAAGSLRRHLRRREIADPDESRTDSSAAFATSWNDKTRQNTGRSRKHSTSRRGGADGNGHGNDTVSFFIDVKEWQNRATEAAHTTGNKARRVADRVMYAVRGSIDEVVEAVTVLRGSVAVRPSGRIEFCAPRSYVGVAGRGLATLLALTLATIWLVRKVTHYFWWNGLWGHKGAREGGYTVRDRSLGGREVFVGSAGAQSRRRVGSMRARGAGRGRIVGPLDDVEENMRSERMAQNNGAGSAMRRRQVALPAWWPSDDVAPLRSLEAREAARRSAQSLMRRMIDNRTVGQDFAVADILELRRVCRENGVSVTIDLSNTRDALYREAVHLALNACTSKGGLELGTEGMGPNAPVRFVAGLSSNIGLERTRAATMVNAAVAARTRSALMQAFAYLAQRKDEEAKEELRSLVRVHEMFPAAPGSAEMEMVAGGLASRWSKDERERLWKIYVSAGGEATESIGAEALGLGMLVR